MSFWRRFFGDVRRSESQPPLRCPQCGFSYEWDGHKCGHCGFGGGRCGNTKQISELSNSATISNATKWFRDSSNRHCSWTFILPNSLKLQDKQQWIDSVCNGPEGYHATQIGFSQISDLLPDLNMTIKDHHGVTTSDVRELFDIHLIAVCNGCKFSFNGDTLMTVCLYQSAGAAINIDSERQGLAAGVCPRCSSKLCKLIWQGTGNKNKK